MKNVDTICNLMKNKVHIGDKLGSKHCPSNEKWDSQILRYKTTQHHGDFDLISGPVLFNGATGIEVSRVIFSSRRRYVLIYEPTGSIELSRVAYISASHRIKSYLVIDSLNFDFFI